MQQSILNEISSVGNKYAGDGFIILGVFGSFARGDAGENSDIDILYRCGPILSHAGLRFFSVYQQVKSDLESRLGRRIDLADIDGLNEVGKKYILPELLHVHSA